VAGSAFVLVCRLSGQITKNSSVAGPGR
jgi:hypothetical protein